MQNQLNLQNRLSGRNLLLFVQRIALGTNVLFMEVEHIRQIPQSVFQQYTMGL